MLEELQKSQVVNELGKKEKESKISKEPQKNKRLAKQVEKDRKEEEGRSTKKATGENESGKNL